MTNNTDTQSPSNFKAVLKAKAISWGIPFAIGVAMTAAILPGQHASTAASTPLMSDASTNSTITYNYAPAPTSTPKATTAPKVATTPAPKATKKATPKVVKAKIEMPDCSIWADEQYPDLTPYIHTDRCLNPDGTVTFAQ